MASYDTEEKQTHVVTSFSHADSHPLKPQASYEETINATGLGGAVAAHEQDQPLVDIDPTAERRLRRKIDFYVVPTVSILYLFCYIDRANVGNARIAGLQKDLHMKGYDYNILLTCFYISYILFEFPANMMCKWVGPGWFIPTCSLCFGIASLGTAYVHNLGSACGVRFILGIFEAGMLPGIAYYLSRWYRRDELAFRLSLYVVMAPLAGAFGGLLAYAILKLDHFGALKTWRMLFGIEGIITIGLSVISFFTLTDRPETARWLTQEEKALASARLKCERVGTTTVLDSIDTKKIRRGVLSPVTLPIAFVFLCNNITVQGLGFFAPTIITTIYTDESVVQQQLRTVPPYIVGAFCMVFNAALSWRFDKVNVILMAAAPLCMVGYIMFLASTMQLVRYGAIFIIAAGAFTFGPLCNAQVSANTVSDTARAAAIATDVMFGNLGGLVSTWSFLPFDGPNYHIGNGLNLAANSAILIVIILLTLWMAADNKKRDKVRADATLSSLSQKEVEDLDWKHPGFRWRP